MTKVSTWSGLQVALNKALEQALRDTSEKAVDIVKDRVDKDVYGASIGTPVIYERTFQLRDSLDVIDFRNKGNSIQATIGHDTSRITSVGYLGQHASLVDGSSSVGSIASIVHDGKAGKILGEGFWTQKRLYMSNSIDIMKNGDYRKFMIDSLNRQGYKVK